MFAQEPLHQETLDQIEALAPNDGLRLVERITDAFVADAPRQTRRMRAGMQLNAHEDLRRASHALKSSALSIGAEPLARLCGRVEDHATRHEVDAVPALLDDIDEEIERVREALMARLAAGDGRVRR